jgi:hypothetical protein
MEDSVNGHRLDDEGERMVEVNPRSLLEATHHPLSLMMLEGAVRVKLVLEHPFARDDVDTWRMRHKGPSLVGLQSVELKLHHGAPVRVLKCGAHRRQYH